MPSPTRNLTRTHTPPRLTSTTSSRQHQHHPSPIVPPTAYSPTWPYTPSHPHPYTHSHTNSHSHPSPIVPRSPSPTPSFFASERGSVYTLDDHDLYLYDPFAAPPPPVPPRNSSHTDVDVWLPPVDTHPDPGPDSALERGRARERSGYDGGTGTLRKIHTSTPMRTEHDENQNQSQVVRAERGEGGSVPTPVLESRNGMPGRNVSWPQRADFVGLRTNIKRVRKCGTSCKTYLKINFDLIPTILRWKDMKMRAIIGLVAAIVVALTIYSIVQAVKPKNKGQQVQTNEPASARVEGSSAGAAAAGAIGEGIQDEDRDSTVAGTDGAIAVEDDAAAGDGEGEVEGNAGEDVDVNAEDVEADVDVEVDADREWW
ncbi:hypothetical protein H0H81_000516 [Sphagnurus paluster]|uniref:Uncharacterized protein n=1 Tax=Sphagnurus paluster TaxID=117069 RepID=A0A9P7FTH6_9AGAR|nr:hypothetical protein H0H81_000516 [Sphagnurus paluster]